MEIGMKDGTAIVGHAVKNDKEKYVGVVTVIEPIKGFNNWKRDYIMSVMGPFNAKTTARDYVEAEIYNVRRALRKLRKGSNHG